MDEQIKIKKVDIFKDSSYQDRTKINLALEDRFELKNVSDKQIIKKEHQENLNSKYQLVNQDRVVEICQYNNEQTALSDKDHKNLRKERESKIKKDDKEFLEAQREEIERSLGTNVKYDSTIIEKFTRDYVGNNYKSARNEIETILKLAQLYENGQTLYMTNKEGMQVPINYDFIEFVAGFQ